MVTVVEDIYTEFLRGSGWKDRDGQRQMMLELGDWVRGSGGDSVAIQAPTGTGKSVAALLAAVESMRLGGGRLVIGTSTVILSEQYRQDIREVQRHFRDVSFAVLKGASNYLCKNNCEEAMLRHKKGTPRRKQMEREIGLFLSGRTEEIPFWAQADTERCMECRGGTGGRTLAKCDYALARAEALQADVVVTSHAMIQCDLKVRAETESVEGILGPVAGFVFDEAHQLGRLLYSATLRQKDVLDLESWGLLSRMGGLRKRSLVEHFDKLEGLRQRMDEAELNESQEQYEWFNPSSGRAAEVLEVFPSLPELVGMKELVKGWGSGSSAGSRDAAKARVILSAFVAARAVLQEAARGNCSGNKAFFLTSNKWDGFRYHIRNMQADGWFLKQLEKFKVAYTSATLGTESAPTYVLESLGISGVRFVAVESSFDYGKQMQWTWLDSGPNGSVGVAGWLHGVVSGGTLALVGGHWSKDKLADGLVAAGVGPVLRQAGSQAVGKNRLNVGLIDRFKDGGGVLVGTDAFATGLDLKGSALTKLLVDGVREIREPVAYKSWKFRWLAARGLDGRQDYELPERAIVLEQQVGRLIRTEEDLGCVVLLFDLAGERGLKQEIVLEAMKRFAGARWVPPAELGRRA